MGYIDKIKLPDNKTYDIKHTIIPVVGTQTAATGNWTGNIDVPALYDGLTIAYFLPYTGSGNATLNLTLKDGTKTGAINCYYNSGRLTTHYDKGSNIIMTYWSAGSVKINGAATTDNRWVAQADYNSDGTGYYVRRIYPNLKAGTNKIFPYTMIMQNADGRWESLVTSSTINSTKTRNTHGFRLGQVLLMYGNATYNADVAVGAYNIWSMHSGLIDHRYSFNTENNVTKGTTGYKPIYLVGTINSTDGLFYLDETWWTQTLPSTDNGKVYIYIGDAYDYYRMTFVDTQKFYKYTNGALREISQDTVTVNGHTVKKDVPSDAVFTDTKNTTGSTDTSSKIFLIGATSQAANPQTYSDNQVFVTNGALQASTVNGTILGVNAFNGTSGGISLYDGTRNIDNYGIAFRLTSNKEKHGYVQGDWATYFTMNGGGNTRGWVYRQNKTGGNVASISGLGHMVLNGSLTVGGNQTNTSGCRMEYNTTTQSLDFIFN